MLHLIYLNVATDFEVKCCCGGIFLRLPYCMMLHADVGRPDVSKSDKMFACNSSIFGISRPISTIYLILIKVCICIHTQISHISWLISKPSWSPTGSIWWEENESFIIALAVQNSLISNVWHCFNSSCLPNIASSGILAHIE
jgi:hypothetical protein